METGQQQGDTLGAVDLSGLPQLSVSERVARGKAARREVSRSSHAAFEPSPHRLDPVELLERQADSRVPELVPIRYGRMLASPFTFYRGAALIMAADLASTPRTGFIVQCCGDAHLSNFGLYGSPERRLVFDINDFDETLPGPWEWDVKRLAVSMLICARSSGFTVAEQERVVLETVAAYRTWMARFAGMRNLAVWYTRFEIEKLMPQLRSQVGGKMRKRLDKAVAKAFRRDNVQAFSKLSGIVDGERRIISDPPLIVRLDDFPESEERDRLKADGERLLLEYTLTLPHERRILLNQFRLVDSARKVVGVGSVGTAAWVALLLGRDTRDPLFLQIKEAQRSVLEEFVGASEFENGGERVVAGQRVMQASSDIFLGWLHIPESVFGQERDYYVRQLRDWKGSVAVEAMDPQALSVYGQLCSATLAHAHARSGDRIAIASYVGRREVFDRAVLAFSEAYAEQNDRDYAALRGAAASGRVLADHTLMGLRRLLFEQGDNLAGGIYGTILVTSIVAAADSSEAIWESLGIVEVTVLVFWLAHVYAHALAFSLSSKQPFSAHELRPIARKEWPLLQAAVVPTVALVAGGVGLLRIQTAYWVAIGYGVAALIWWGLLIARKEGLSRRVTCIVVLANASFGLVIVLLKEFVNH